MSASLSKMLIRENSAATIDCAMRIISLRRLPRGAHRPHSHAMTLVVVHAPHMWRSIYLPIKSPTEDKGSTWSQKILNATNNGTANNAPPIPQIHPHSMRPTRSTTGLISRRCPRIIGVTNQPSRSARPPVSSADYKDMAQFVEGQGRHQHDHDNAEHVAQIGNERDQGGHCAPEDGIRHAQQIHGDTDQRPESQLIQVTVKRYRKSCPSIFARSPRLAAYPASEGVPSRVSARNRSPDESRKYNRMRVVAAPMRNSPVTLKNFIGQASLLTSTCCTFFVPSNWRLWRGAPSPW